MMAETKKHGGRDKSLMAKQSWGRQRQKNTRQRQKNTRQRQKNMRQRQKNTSALVLEARASEARLLLALKNVAYPAFAITVDQNIFFPITRFASIISEPKSII